METNQRPVGGTTPGDDESTAEREYVSEVQDRRSPNSDAASDVAGNLAKTDTRRQFLAAVGAASTGALAGCPTGSNPTNESDPTDEPGTATPDNPATSTPGSTPQPVEAVGLPAAALGELELGVVGFEQITVSQEDGDGGGGT